MWILDKCNNQHTLPTPNTKKSILKTCGKTVCGIQTIDVSEINWLTNLTKNHNDILSTRRNDKMFISNARVQECSIEKLIFKNILRFSQKVFKKLLKRVLKIFKKFIKSFQIRNIKNWFFDFLKKFSNFFKKFRSFISDNFLKKIIFKTIFFKTKFFKKQIVN